MTMLKEKVNIMTQKVDLKMRTKQIMTEKNEPENEIQSLCQWKYSFTLPREPSFFLSWQAHFATKYHFWNILNSLLIGKVLSQMVELSLKQSMYQNSLYICCFPILKRWQFWQNPIFEAIIFKDQLGDPNESIYRKLISWCFFHFFALNQ